MREIYIEEREREGVRERERGTEGATGESRRPSPVVVEVVALRLESVVAKQSFFFLMHEWRKAKAEWSYSTN